MIPRCLGDYIKFRIEFLFDEDELSFEWFEDDSRASCKFLISSLYRCLEFNLDAMFCFSELVWLFVSLKLRFFLLWIF